MSLKIAMIRRIRMSEAFPVCLLPCYFCNVHDLDVFCLFVSASSLPSSVPAPTSVLLNCIPFSADVVDLLVCLFSHTDLIAA